MPSPVRRRAYTDAPLHSPAEQAREEREARAKMTQIRMSMETFDRMPARCRQIAHEYTLPNISAARKALGFEYPLSDEQWDQIEAFLDACRARKQEDIFERGLAAFVSRKSA